MGTVHFHPAVAAAELLQQQAYLVAIARDRHAMHRQRDALFHHRLLHRIRPAAGCVQSGKRADDCQARVQHAHTVVPATGRQPRAIQTGMAHAPVTQTR
ncbi:hypothetical protein G6F46_015000 [Rhizopus delemar]|nr:hypothetical protein G6F40_017396 [Rhizopus arrhizus]KAG1584237.1 hypothetical protein G6F46_015000 [Rhizopus delemar]